MAALLLPFAVVIVRAAPPLTADEAARRAATGADPIWISSPGGSASGSGDGNASGDVEIAFDVVAADPVNVIRGDSLVALEQAWTEARLAWSKTGGPPLPDTPVAIGWLAYDLARRWIPLDGRASIGEGEDEWAPIEFRFFDAVWMLPAGAAAARIFACDDAAADRLADRLGRPSPALPPPRLGALSGSWDRQAAYPAGQEVVRSDARVAHTAALARIKEYLFAGDVYQVNLARRLTASVSAGDPLWMAATLRARAPAPHAVWLGSGSHGAVNRYVVGNSPERFLRVGVDGAIETRPIKGTRARTGDAAADALARGALAAAAKDRAEHVMIIDLERNDLGRVCETGTVTVDGLLRLVELPTVFHLVSTVRGQLRKGIGLCELLQATFPGGSVTGAPKRRAMEIIEELEPVRRGIYTGATGWLGASGDLDLAVAIRTATVTSGRMSLFVGGGIVVDSDAAAEWDETEVKARAFLELCQTVATIG